MPAHTPLSIVIYSLFSIVDGTSLPNIGHGKCSNMVNKIMKKKLREHAQNCDVLCSLLSHKAPVSPSTQPKGKNVVKALFANYYLNGESEDVCQQRSLY